MDADFVDIDGKTFRLSDYKGKVLLINLWATWCGPCRPQMTKLNDLQNSYRDEGLEVIGLDIGDAVGKPEGVPQIKAFARRLGINYYLGRSPKATTDQVNKLTKAPVVPQSILIDRVGRLRGVFIGSGSEIHRAMQSNVEKLLLSESPK